MYGGGTAVSTSSGLIVTVGTSVAAPTKTGVSVGGKLVDVGMAVGGGVDVAGAGGRVARIAVGITAVAIAVGSAGVDETRMQPVNKSSRPTIKQQKRETILITNTQ